MLIIKPLIALVATSMLSMKLVRHFGQKRQQRRVRDDHQRHRDDVHRWEGEGGNLPPRPQR
jgi:uncharacterized membrane protein YdjX (TVP38/TMEM64 family)